MTSAVRRIGVIVVVAALADAGALFAQQPPPGQTAPARGQRVQPQRPGGQRQGVPPEGAAMNAQQVQELLDTFAVMQAEQALQLSEEQYPNFVAHLRRLQSTRRRFQQERQRMLRELNGLAQRADPSRDEVLLAKLRELDDLAQRAAQQMRERYAELDGVLSPVQRARFRFFEDQLERRKIELLMKLGGRQQ